jgi:hypothetical protein
MPKMQITQKIKAKEGQRRPFHGGAPSVSQAPVSKHE